MLPCGLHHSEMPRQPSLPPPRHLSIAAVMYTPPCKLRTHSAVDAALVLVHDAHLVRVRNSGKSLAHDPSRPRLVERGGLALQQVAAGVELHHNVDLLRVLDRLGWGGLLHKAPHKCPGHRSVAGFPRNFPEMGPQGSDSASSCCTRADASARRLTSQGGTTSGRTSERPARKTFGRPETPPGPACNSSLQDQLSKRRGKRDAHRCRSPSLLSTRRGARGRREDKNNKYNNTSKNKKTNTKTNNNNSNINNDNNTNDGNSKNNKNIKANKNDKRTKKNQPNNYNIITLIRIHIITIRILRRRRLRIPISMRRRRRRRRRTINDRSEGQHRVPTGAHCINSGCAKNSVTNGCWGWGKST